MQRNFKIRALGEIAIRCANIAAMADFYENTLGLDRLSGDHSEGIIFFKISDGFQGHTAILALFRHNAPQRTVHPQGTTKPQTGEGSSLHHIALSLPFAEQQAAMDWYDAQGVDYDIQHFGWIGWRGIFAKDPDGNTVELVSYDDSLKD